MTVFVRLIISIGLFIKFFVEVEFDFSRKDQTHGTSSSGGRVVGAMDPPPLNFQHWGMKKILIKTINIFSKHPHSIFRTLFKSHNMKAYLVVCIVCSWFSAQLDRKLLSVCSKSFALNARNSCKKISSLHIQRGLYLSSETYSQP